MTDDWQRLGSIETDAHRRLLNPQGNLEWMTWEERTAFYGELRGYGKDRGYKPAWAAMKYKDRFGEFPNDPRVRDAPVLECSVLTRMWIKASMEDLWKRARGKAVGGSR